jgi:hypothetical protein
LHPYITSSISLDRRSIHLHTHPSPTNAGRLCDHLNLLNIRFHWSSHGFQEPPVFSPFYGLIPLPHAIEHLPTFLTNLGRDMSINPSGLQGTPIDPFHDDQVHGGRSQRRRERLMSGAHREVNLVQEDLSSSPSCNNTSSGGQTWLEFLRDTRTHDNGEPSSQQQLDTRRSSMMALDRKRRLTGSLDESARRRAASGGIYRHGHPYGLATDSHTNLVSRVGGPSPHWGSTTTDSPLRDVTSPPTPPPHPSMRGRSSASRRDSAVREYVRPLWQPDSEVTKCPICGTQFTFWYRKHHCRKCGRVVCASCSPHRITIPHQFIVQPPNSTTDTATTPTDETGVEVIDLTEDDSGSRPRTMSNPNPPPEDHLNDPPNPALGGGAEVRLCNPCVPDPNPNPPQPYRSLFATQGAPTVPSNYRAPGYLDRPSTRNPHAWNPNQGGPSGARAPSYMRSEEYRRQHGLVSSIDVIPSNMRLTITVSRR